MHISSWTYLHEFISILFLLVTILKQDIVWQCTSINTGQEIQWIKKQFCEPRIINRESKIIGLDQRGILLGICISFLIIYVVSSYATASLWKEFRTAIFCLFRKFFSEKNYKKFPYQLLEYNVRQNFSECQNQLCQTFDDCSSNSFHLFESHLETRGRTRTTTKRKKTIRSWFQSIHW